MALKISAPVGATTRAGQGPKVKNNKPDVQLIQQMLVDNGCTLDITGRCDTKTVKAIMAIQKRKLKGEKPTGIIDPGSKSFGCLIAGYAIAQKKRRASKYVLLTLPNGKEAVLTQKEYDKISAEALKRLRRLAAAFRGQYETHHETYHYYLDVAMIKEGFLAALTNMMVLKFKDISLPDVKLLNNCNRSLASMDRALASGNFANINKAFKQAEADLNILNNAMRTFLNQIISSASTLCTISKVTAGTSFMVVGVLAGPVLVSGAGLSTLQAAMVGGSGVAAVKSMATEIGEHSVGNHRSLKTSITNVVIDSTIGGATAGVGAKLKLTFIDKWAKSLAPRAVKLMGAKVSEKAMRKLLKNYLGAGGKAAVKSAISEAIKTVGKTAKTGKLPTEKDFDSAAQNIIFAALSAGLFKKVQKSNEKWSKNLTKFVNKHMVPLSLKRVTGNTTISKKTQAKIVADIDKKLMKMIARKGFDYALEGASGTESSDEIVSRAQTIVLNDSMIEKLIDQITMQHIKEAAR